MNEAADKWCADQNRKFTEKFGYKPSRLPDQDLFERVLRLGVEAQLLGIDYDDVHTLLNVANATYVKEDINDEWPSKFPPRGEQVKKTADLLGLEIKDGRLQIGRFRRRVS